MSKLSDFQRKSIIFILAGALTAAAVMQVVFFGRQSHISENKNAQFWEEQPEKKAKKLAAWLQDQPIPVKATKQWAEALKNAKSEGCLDVPEGTTAVSGDSVPPNVTAALDEALVGLLQVYIDNSPEAFFSYMNAHDEKPTQQQLNDIVSIIGAIRKTPSPNLKGLSPQQIYVTHWRECKIKMHWSSFLKNSICKQFWRSHQPPNEKLRQSIGRDESQLFQVINTIRHFFAPQQPIESLLQTEDHILFVDVKVVIRLDKACFAESVPYYFRFWYDPQKNIWHPYQLARVLTGPEAIKVQHFF